MSNAIQRQSDLLRVNEIMNFDYDILERASLEDVMKDVEVPMVREQENHIAI